MNKTNDLHKLMMIDKEKIKQGIMDKDKSIFRVDNDTKVLTLNEIVSNKLVYTHKKYNILNNEIEVFINYNPTEFD